MTTTNIKQIRKLPRGADLSHIHQDLHVLAVPISLLMKHPDNPRLHPDRNREAIAGSLSKYLQRKNVVVNMTDHGLRLEAGHGVYTEMLESGSEYIAAAIMGDDPVTELGFMLADNRAGDLSEDDPEKLRAVVRQIVEMDQDAEIVGWNEEELRKMLAVPGDGEKDPPDDDAPIDRAAELQKVWDTARGQVWEIPSGTVPGRCHRVWCGDCRDIAISLDPDIDLIVTDPPYGVSYADKNAFLNAISPGNRIQTPIENDHQKPADMKQIWIDAFTAIRPKMKSGACYYVTGPQGGELLLLLLALQETGFHLRHMLIWAKNNHVLGRCDYNYKHEPILYGWVDGSHKWYGSGSETSLWEIPKPQKSDLHPTMKPVELYARAIRNSTERGQRCVDIFAGSGTLLMAAEQEGRLSESVEFTPGYTAVILERAKAAGLEPRLVT